MASWAFIRQALREAGRQSDRYTPLMVFVLISLLFPLALGAKPQLMQAVAPGVIWVALLLAVILSVDGLFRQDYEDGSLALWALQKQGLMQYLTGRLLAVFILQLLPLLLVSPIMAHALGLRWEALPWLLLTGFLALPSLLCLGAAIAALTLSAARSGMLNALLALPLFLPVLIFAASAVERAQDGLSIAGPVYLLAALLAVILVLSPLAIAASLKLSVRRG